MNGKSVLNIKSKSLLTRDVYGICFTECESLNCTKDNFFVMRKNFLSHARKSVKTNEKIVFMGLQGKIKGKLSSRSIIWKKWLGNVVVEQSYQVKTGTVLVRRNFENMITSKVFFDKNHHWLKSEYYDAPDAITAQVILKPVTLGGEIERFKFNPQTGGYYKEALIPLPYDIDSPEQKAIDAELGRPSVIVWTAEGLFSYTTEEEVQKRIDLADKNQKKEVESTLEWQDSVVEAKPEKDWQVSFSSINEYAEVKDLKQKELKDGQDIQKEEKNQPETESVKDKREEKSFDLSKRNHRINSDTKNKAVILPEQILADEATALIAKNKANETDKTLNTSVTDEDFLFILQKAEEKVNARIKEAGQNTLLSVSKLREHLNRNPVLKQLLPTELEKHFSIRSLQSVSLKNDFIESLKKQNVNISEDLFPIEQQLAAFVESVEQSLNTDFPIKKMKDGAEKSSHLSAEEKTKAERETIYRAAVIDGKIAGISGIKRNITAARYEGDTKDGKRHGFGVSYSENGALSYVGFWENDQKSGLGISFRETDHAVHVANWTENKPDSFVSLFDTKGNLQYSGTIQDGKKNGIGISYRLEDGSVFVGKWEKGQPTGFGSVFDTHGHLIYTGMWKDGRRNGTGSEFNQDGEVVFTGEWKDDKHYNGVLYKRPRSVDE